MMMMKILLLILTAGICSVFGSGGGGQMDPCLKKCKDDVVKKLNDDPQLSHFNVYEKLKTPEGRAHVRTCVKNYISASTDSTPDFVKNPAVWAKLCPIATEAETCVNKCPESPIRGHMLKKLTLFKLGCDEDFKSSIACLFTVVTPECQTKCVPLAAKLQEFIKERDAKPDEQVAAPKDVVESGCKFVNCRLNCRKEKIVEKCQQKGFESAKKLTSALAIQAKGMYKHFGGDHGNWPEICDQEKIVQPTPTF